MGTTQNGATSVNNNRNQLKRRGLFSSASKGGAYSKGSKKTYKKLSEEEKQEVQKWAGGYNKKRFALGLVFCLLGVFATAGVVYYFFI